MAVASWAVVKQSACAEMGWGAPGCRGRGYNRDGHRADCCSCCSGLSAATEITSFVLLGPWAGSALRWGRPYGARRSSAAGTVKISYEVPADPARLAGHSILGGRNSPPSIPGITFRAPMPWGSLLVICYLL